MLHWEGRPGETATASAKLFGEHCVLWEAEHDRQAVTCWTSADKVVVINGSKAIIEDVVRQYLIKYPSGLPRDYSIDNTRLLLGLIDFWQERLAKSIDEPCAMLRDDSAQWIWDDAFYELSCFCMPQHIEIVDSAGASIAHQIPDRNVYNRLMMGCFKEHILGSDMSRPIGNVVEYERAVRSWRRQFVDTVIPGLRESLRQRGVIYDPITKAWKLGPGR